MKTYLGIEFGSTRIKAVQIDEGCKVHSSGDYTWPPTATANTAKTPITDRNKCLRHKNICVVEMATAR